MEDNQENIPPTTQLSTGVLPKVKTFWIFILALIIVAGIVSWTAILFYPKQTDKNLPVSVSEMENWKTYRNDMYGFEFKYPSDWVVEHEINSGDLDRVVLYLPRDLEYGTGVTFIATDSKLGGGIELDRLEKEGKIQKKEKIVLNNIEYSVYYYNNNEYERPYEIIISFAKDNKNYWFVSNTNNNYQSGRQELDLILSTFKFNTPKFDYSKPFQKGEFDYFGVVTLTGYLSVRDLECQSAEDESICGESMTYKYASFNFTNTDNELIKTYLNEISGNWYVREKSIGLGCYDKNKSAIESLNYDDNGSVKNIVTGQELETLLSSSESKQIKLQVTKSYLSLGGGAPNCYSLFREFKVVD